MASEKVLELSGENFDNQVLQADKPVLVDFWAEWCGPCRLVAPVLEEIAQESDRVQVAKLNIDDNRDLAIQYNVQSIPTFILFKNGEVADRMMGAMPKSAFQAFLDRNA